MKNVRTSNGRTTLEFDCFNCRVFVAALFAVAVKFKGKARVFVDGGAVDFADREILKWDNGAGGAVLCGNGVSRERENGGKVGEKWAKMEQKWQNGSKSGKMAQKVSKKMCRSDTKRTQKSGHQRNKVHKKA